MVFGNIIYTPSLTHTHSLSHTLPSSHSHSLSANDLNSQYKQNDVKNHFSLFAAFNESSLQRKNAKRRN